MSLNVDQETQTLEAAIRRAQAAGVIVVAASGNSCNAGTGVRFPATVSDVIAVGASNQDGTYASYSCTGPEISIAAPGTSLYSTLLGGGSGIAGNGTSFATPMVSGAIANLLALDPRLGPARIKALLASTSLAVSGSIQTFGILDAGAAVQGLLANVTPSVIGQNIQVGYTLPITAGAVNVYLSVLTPIGEFALLPGGGWQGINANTPRTPLASGDAGASSQRGNLFGANGIFAPIPLTGLPAGNYVWRVSLASANNGNAIGPIIESSITLP